MAGSRRDALSCSRLKKHITVVIHENIEIFVFRLRCRCGVDPAERLRRGEGPSEAQTFWERLTVGPRLTEPLKARSTLR